MTDLSRHRQGIVKAARKEFLTLRVEAPVTGMRKYRTFKVARTTYAHQYRLQQAQQLLIEAGAVEEPDGKWHFPKELEGAG